jgi:hypothetical protein
LGSDGDVMERKDIDDFKMKLKQGRIWEEKAAEWIREKGWTVIDLASADFNGAPHATLPGGRRLTLPDLQCFKDGKMIFVEVKKKTKAFLFKKDDMLTTGIDLQKWFHYCKLSYDTKTRIYLMFIHKQEGKVVCDHLIDLAKHVIIEPGAMKHGMAFWEFASLTEIRELTTKEEML